MSDFLFSLTVTVWRRGSCGPARFRILRLRSDAAAIATGEAVNVRLGLRALPEPNTT
jgi:hypothetical protein